MVRTERAADDSSLKNTCFGSRIRMKRYPGLTDHPSLRISAAEHGFALLPRGTAQGLISSPACVYRSAMAGASGKGKTLFFPPSGLHLSHASCFIKIWNKRIQNERKLITFFSS